MPLVYGEILRVVAVGGSYSVTARTQSSGGCQWRATVVPPSSWIGKFTFRVTPG